MTTANVLKQEIKKEEALDAVAIVIGSLFYSYFLNTPLYRCDARLSLYRRDVPLYCRDDCLRDLTDSGQLLMNCCINRTRLVHQKPGTNVYPKYETCNLNYVQR